jgi:hypothetical protein
MVRVFALTALPLAAASVPRISLDLSAAGTLITSARPAQEHPEGFVGSHSVSNTRCHGAGSSNRFEHTIQGPVSLTIGAQNAIKSCRWSSDFCLILVLFKDVTQ